MSKNIKIKGLKDLDKAIKKQVKSVEEASKPQSVSMSELFDNGFMSKHTNGTFSTFESFIKTKFPDTTFSKIPESELDAWVNSQTDYSSWKNFQTEAENAYLAKKLGF